MSPYVHILQIGNKTILFFEFLQLIQKMFR